MKFDKIHVHHDRPLDYAGQVAIWGWHNENVKIFHSSFSGPVYIDRNTQIGPHMQVGKYTGFNESGFFARGRVGAYCAFGARNSINPFNHPTDWLSTHEFQYHPKSFDWIEEWREFERLERTPDMFKEVWIGNDVWTGHNVVIMPGVVVGNGACIGANSVVTHNVDDYAIVAGAPARLVRYRFRWETIQRLKKIRWWDFELSQLSGMNFRDVAGCLDKLEVMRASEDAGQPAEAEAEYRKPQDTQDARGYSYRA